jgi:hypothetical protein
MLILCGIFPKENKLAGRTASFQVIEGEPAAGNPPTDNGKCRRKTRSSGDASQIMKNPFIASNTPQNRQLHATVSKKRCFKQVQ